MPSFASRLLVLLAFAVELSSSGEVVCASKSPIYPGDYSDLVFFSCLIDGDNLIISWSRPEAVPSDVVLPYQVEYQCYNESLAQNTSVINNGNNAVVKSEASGQEFMGDKTVNKSDSSCLVTGCYEDTTFRGKPVFYWIKENDCTSAPVPLSSVAPVTVSTVTTFGAMLFTSLGNSVSPFHSDSASSSGGGPKFIFSPTALSVITQLVAMETPQPNGISASEVAGISFSTVVVLLVAMAIVTVMSTRLFLRRKRNNRLAQKEEEAEIVRLSMKNREIFSVSLGELSVIFTPYQSLESICIQSFEEPPHHVITVKQEKRANPATHQAADSPQEDVLGALSPEKTEFSSFTSDEGYIYQGPPPSYDTCPTKPLALSLECAVDESGSTGEEGRSLFFYRRMSQSENSLDQGYITSEYAGTRFPPVEDFVFNQPERTVLDTQL